MQITLNEATAAERRIPFLAVRASANSLQLVDLGDIATADTFTLTVTNTTGAITFAADMSSAIVTALEGLAELEAGDVQAFKLATGQVYAVGFAGSVTGTSIPLMAIGSPTTFTPGDVTGGVTDSAVVGLGADWPAADIRISKAGVAEAESDGTVAEVVDGIYDYIADAGEVDTLGRLVGSVRTFGVSVYPFSAQVIPVATGSTVLHSGTAQAGASGSITLAAGASGTSDHYVPCIVKITAGTGANQGGRIVTAYNGTSKVATIAPPWVTAPDDTSEYELEPIGAVLIDDIAAAVQAEILADSTPFAGANVDAAVSTRATPAQVTTAIETYDGPTNAEMEARTLSAASVAKLTAHGLAVLTFEVAAGSTTTAIVLETVNGAAPSATNDFYNDMVLIFTAGALAGQRRLITDYDGGTVTLTTEAFTGSAADGDTGVIV